MVTVTARRTVKCSNPMRWCQPLIQLETYDPRQRSIGARQIFRNNMEMPIRFSCYFAGYDSLLVFSAMRADKMEVITARNSAKPRGQSDFVVYNGGKWIRMTTSMRREILICADSYLCKPDLLLVWGRRVQIIINARRRRRCHKTFVCVRLHFICICASKPRS